ncbi:MAG: hypothetical protein LBG21_04070 [Campylobacteraceae bacterium]|jgi:hypothetical protein|nr:hypothetical protein [Campylobacteraceae bacterium]
MNLIDFLRHDKNIILYRKELNSITGSITATILLQQIIFLMSDKDSFYKFKEPCNHRLYKEGDSWCEELGFSREEFDSALKRLKSKGFVTTKITQDRVTYYFLDKAALEKELNALYEKQEIRLSKSVNPTLDNSIIFEETENNSKKYNIPSEAKASSLILSTPLSPLVKFEAISSFSKCEICKRRARFKINDIAYCGQHTRIELSKYGKLELLNGLEAKEESFKEGSTSNSQSTKINSPHDFAKVSESTKHTCAKEQWEEEAVVVKNATTQLQREYANAKYRDCIKDDTRLAFPPKANSTVSKTETVPLSSFISQEIWDEWVQDRRARKKPLTPLAVQKQLKQLSKWHEEGYDVNQIIEQSIANGYQGLFKPREKPKDDNDGWSFKYKEGWSW